MKLNESELKDMIRDTLREVEQKFTGTTQAATSQHVRSGAMAQAKEQASGLTNDERGLIKELIGLLTTAAKKTNIASGMPAQKINQLAVILKKVAGEQQQTQQGEGV